MTLSSVEGTLLDGLNHHGSETYSSNQFEKLNQLKKDVIYQSVETGRKMIEPSIKTNNDEQKSSSRRKARKSNQPKPQLLL